MTHKLTVAHWGEGGKEAPVICATAAWNGLGTSPYQIWAFRRADLTAFSFAPFLCPNGNCATMAQIRSLPPTAAGGARMLPVALASVERLLEGLRPSPKGLRIGVVLCLPERMNCPGSTKRFVGERKQLENSILKKVREHIPEAAIWTVARGHASLGYALLEFGAALMSQGLDAIIIGGVDTHYDPEIVEELIQQARIFDGENVDCFIGGEGAAFALMTRPSVARRAGWPILSRVDSVATNAEPAPALSDLPCNAVGLSRAARVISERLCRERRKLDWWLSDMTAEDYRVHEFQLVWPRASHDVMESTSTLEFLPQHLGDLGAATMPTALAIAVEGFLRGDPAARTCLFTGTSTGEDRAAVLISVPT